MPFALKMPKLSPTMEEGAIAKWHKKEGEFVEADELLLEIATDKATVEHNALDEGWVRKIIKQEGESAQINEPLAILSETKDESLEGFELPKKKVLAPKEQVSAEREKEKTTPSQPAFVPKPVTLKKAPKAGKIIASPLAKKLAKEKGLDLSTVQGSGPGGRITSKDLEKAQPLGIVTFGHSKVPTIASGTYEEIPLTPMRKTIGKRLQESKSFIPHFYVRQRVNASPIIALREQLKALGIKVSYNDLVIRAAALALREHPGVNTGFNSESQSIVWFKTVDISVAVGFEGGLITPILRHADFKDLGELSSEMRTLIEKAREGKLQEEEYIGGSFCISNLGMYGISDFVAVINPPQAAILAVGGIEARPVVEQDCVVAGKTITLTLSADHRVIDGALAAQFLKTLQHLLENPVALTI